MITSLDQLSGLFVALRAAVVDRTGKVRPNIDPELADRALALVERFRVWADTAPMIPDRTIWEQWEAEYTRMRAELGAAGAPLIDIDRPGPLERALGAAGIVVAIASALLLWSNTRRR